MQTCSGLSEQAALRPQLANTYNTHDSTSTAGDASSNQHDDIESGNISGIFSSLQVLYLLQKSGCLQACGHGKSQGRVAQITLRDTDFAC